MNLRVDLRFKLYCLMSPLQPVSGPLLPPGAAQRAAGRGVALSSHPARDDSSLLPFIVYLLNVTKNVYSCLV